MTILRLVNSENGQSLSSCPPAEFKDLAIKEREHIEAWLVAHPEVIDPQMVVISSEYDAFDKTKERLDILGAVALDDGTVRLVVLELKRSGTSTTADLQAIKYAAYVSTLTWDDIVAAYAEHSDGGAGDAAQSLREALDLPEDEAEPAVDDRPRIVLVASSFRPEVTSTVLWLTDEHGLDIECVALTAHRVGSELVLSTQTLLPLPSVEEFRMRRQQKKAEKTKKADTGEKVDWDRVREIMAQIPPGHWMTYQDLALAAGGSGGAAMAVGQFLAKDDGLPIGCVHRVLKRKGIVSPGFSGEIGGPEEARAELEKEGLTFDHLGRADSDRRWSPSGGAE